MKTEYGCVYHCGYVGDGGEDDLDHELYEHIPCPDCGAGQGDGQDLETCSLSHRKGCPRLEPGYTYPEHRQVP
jgi:hypothetical protein